MKFKTILIEKLGQRIRNKKIVLLMYPFHMNGGDGAIFLGILKLCRLVNAEIVLALPDTFLDATVIRSLSYDCVVIVGGGNFGDLYPFYDDFRGCALSELKNKPIIQMPVSIFYSDPDRLSGMKKKISRHGRFHLFVRDQASHDFAKTNFDCPCELVPDIAMILEPEDVGVRRLRGNLETLFWIRDDKESAGCPEQIDRKVDWLSLHPRVYLIFQKYVVMGIIYKRYYKYINRFYNRTSIAVMRFIYSLLFKYAVLKYRYEVSKAMILLSQYDLVVTDRLHIHILSVLLGVKTTLLDNSYHKNRSYHESWTRVVDDHILRQPDGNQGQRDTYSSC